MNPKIESASAFEKNISVFKNEPKDMLIKYLNQIDKEAFKKAYSKKDLPPEILI